MKWIYFTYLLTTYFKARLLIFPSTNSLREGPHISLKTIVYRTKLTRKQARYFVRSKLSSGELRRVDPFEVGSGKFNGNLKNTNLSKDDKKTKEE